MFLIVGLGNPGQKYESTGHNVGFRVIDKIAESFNFVDFSFENNFVAEISKEKIGSGTIILAKPQTFMNLSGKSVFKIALFYKIKPANIIIIHDDIDLTLGKIKIVKNRGPAGHKGVDSIIKSLGGKNFIRVRIGIRPEAKSQKITAQKIVLKKLTEEEQEKITKSIEKTVEIIKTLIKEGLEKAQNKYNK